ncbi:hypothetical protein PIB30_060629 [Stylosanthes scabra]|uniref:Uncharacterized protein n=1 Tax=Stylosanthes scabra TaxID=79078 RepID=A0ABU6ZJA2_9FABA|nr:hypothetical protein [Stylosanthes scabra]
MRVVGIELFFPKSLSLLQSDDYSSLSPLLILAHSAFLGHFQSNSNLSIPETLEQSHQDGTWSPELVSYRDIRVLVRLDKAECVRATCTTWLFGSWYLSMA